MRSRFRVNLIDSYGSLIKLLEHLEYLRHHFTDLSLAVDFEGMRLCRTGALCLVQLSCSADQTLVYVLDVHLLGKKAFSMKTRNGTCLKGLLEDPNLKKVWFDPRNDVDALYYQFAISPRGVFDLQLAEVADRRNRGFNVNFVQGLHKLLCQCPQLTEEQKTFAGRINDMGKNLFEPNNGGSYEVFQQRPLHPIILVYAAHDARYLLTLHEQFYNALASTPWMVRVQAASDWRSRWWMHRTYVVPTSDAPDI